MVRQQSRSVELDCCRTNRNHTHKRPRRFRFEMLSSFAGIASSTSANKFTFCRCRRRCYFRLLDGQARQEEDLVIMEMIRTGATLASLRSTSSPARRRCPSTSCPASLLCVGVLPAKTARRRGRLRLLVTASCFYGEFDCDQCNAGSSGQGLPALRGLRLGHVRFSCFVRFAICILSFPFDR